MGPTLKKMLVKGFKTSAVAAGIKAGGALDLALIYSEQPAAAAAVFTQNTFIAAPLIVSQKHLKDTGYRARAILVNSGNANCATGRPGIRDCKRVCAEGASLLNLKPPEVFPSSTGIIGVPLPVEKITAQLRSLISSAGTSLKYLQQFSEAILTTDSKPKLASVPLQSGRGVITGVAKGAGMIHPQLATMLVYLLTDVAAQPAELRSALRKACDDSFNK